MSFEAELGEAVATLLGRLCLAWQVLMKEALGLDVTLAAPELLAALTVDRPATIDRLRPGFEDFAPASDRLIKSGDPAQSALYHALASPLVQPQPPVAFWPSSSDLDLVENWIYARATLERENLPHGSFIGVFAYEYRPAAATPHRRQADFVYSRTGLARVGETEAVWDGPNRCWSGQGRGGRFAVMPARYAAFIAVDRRPGPGTVSVLGEADENDPKRLFALPLRKLIRGEPLDGTPLELCITEFHRREKLQRLFLRGGYGHPPGIGTWPYVRDSQKPGNGPDGQPVRLVDVAYLGGAVIVSAPPDTLVREAILPDGSRAVLPKVPARSFLHVRDFAWNRSATSLRVNTGVLATVEDALVNEVFDERINVRPRNAPEFANIRHRLKPDGTVEDLGQVVGARFRDVVNDGGYPAILYEDSVCDGVLACKVDERLTDLECRPAFSVVTAPDLFPYVDESEIQDWVTEHNDHNVRHQFRKGGPKPLCEGRLPPNVTLPHPVGTGAAFSSADQTVVAIVSRPYDETRGPAYARGNHSTTTFLSDGASNVFAPGWDVTMSEENGVLFYSTFGLGAPFPEDMKLCAAANGFWPAAAPDAARTFNKGPTAIPLLDEELGWHARNPRRPQSLPPSTGWDGETGPFVAEANTVSFCDFWRSDYVSNAVAGTFGGGTLAGLNTDEVIARMNALRVCIQALEHGTDPAGTRLWLVHAERSTVPPIGTAIPASIGYRYEFVRPSGDDILDPADDRRRLQRFDPTRRYECLVSSVCLHWRTLPDGDWNPVRVPPS